MIVYSVEASQFAQLAADFARAPELMAREATTAINASLLDYQGGIKRFAPVRSGRYRSSVTVIPAQRHGNVIEGSVGPATNYAEAVEVGTGIYGPLHRPITPKRAKVLAFDIGGRKVFARSVKGMKGQFPVKRSFEENQARTEAHFSQAVERVAQ